MMFILECLGMGLLVFLAISVLMVVGELLGWPTWADAALAVLVLALTIGLAR